MGYVVIKTPLYDLDGSDIWSCYGNAEFYDFVLVVAVSTKSGRKVEYVQNLLVMCGLLYNILCNINC